MIILPYMDSNNLHNYLKFHEKNVTVREMLDFAQQVAGGLHFLHTRAKIIHGDLALRNVLLDRSTGSNWVLISDFGKSEKAYNDGNPQELYEQVLEAKEEIDFAQKLPWKWLPIELYSGGCIPVWKKNLVISRAGTPDSAFKK